MRGFGREKGMTGGWITRSENKAAMTDRWAKEGKLKHCNSLLI